MDQSPQTHQGKARQSPIIFSRDEIQNISALGEVLRGIRNRLNSEGVSIEEARRDFLKTYEVQETI